MFPACISLCRSPMSSIYMFLTSFSWSFLNNFCIMEYRWLALIDRFSSNAEFSSLTLACTLASAVCSAVFVLKVAPNPREAVGIPVFCAVSSYERGKSSS